MANYQWRFVEDSRSNKTTGKMVKKLTFYLCIGNKPVKETSDMSTALYAEKMLLEKGDSIDGNTIEEFWDEQLSWINNRDSGFKFKIPRMKRRDFNKWRTKKVKDEQLTIKG